MHKMFKLHIMKIYKNNVRQRSRPNVCEINCGKMRTSKAGMVAQIIVVVYGRSIDWKLVFTISIPFKILKHQIYLIFLKI